MKITLGKNGRRTEVDYTNLGLGDYFSDHMVTCEYVDGAWGEPSIIPFSPIEISPAALALHYGHCFFGVKIDILFSMRAKERSCKLEKYLLHSKIPFRRTFLPVYLSLLQYTLQKPVFSFFLSVFLRLLVAECLSKCTLIKNLLTTE